MQEWSQHVQSRINNGELDYRSFLLEELRFNESRTAEILDAFGLLEVEVEDPAPLVNSVEPSSSVAGPEISSDLEEVIIEDPDARSFLEEPILVEDDSFAIPSEPVQPPRPSNSAIASSVRTPPKARPRPKSSLEVRSRSPIGREELSSSSSCVRRLVPPPQPLRQVFASIPSKFGIYFYSETEGEYTLFGGGVEKLARPSGRHLAVDFNFVLNYCNGRRIRQGQPIPLDNIRVLQEALRLHPTDRILVVSKVESADLIASLLESCNSSPQLHSVIHLIATVPHRTGALGKAALLRALTGSTSDWLVIDDAVEILKEVTSQGGQAINVWIPGRSWGPSWLPWCKGLAEAGEQIAELRNADY